MSEIVENIERAVEDSFEEMERDVEAKARPLAAELIEKIDNFMTKRAGELGELEDAGDMIYEAEAAAINALVYIMCMWTTREAREQELAQVERRVIELLMKRLGAH